MVFIELPIFLKTIKDLFTDEDIRTLQNALLENPELGDVIPAMGGIRKMRFAAKNKGKRSGARIIYFYVHVSQHIYLLFAYAKNTKLDLTHAEKKLFVALLKELT